jgi:hypothetical protein
VNRALAWCAGCLAGLGACAIAARASENAVASALYPEQALICPQYLLRGCCDNYCSKPIPCVRPFCHCCGPNDYCRKPCPCVSCYRSSCCTGCYCGKPCPDLCRPLWGDYFTCAIGDCDCTSPARTSSALVAPSPANPPASPGNNAGVGGSSAAPPLLKSTGQAN